MISLKNTLNELVKIRSFRILRYVFDRKMEFYMIRSVEMLMKICCSTWLRLQRSLRIHRTIGIRRLQVGTIRHYFIGCYRFDCS